MPRRTVRCQPLGWRQPVLVIYRSFSCPRCEQQLRICRSCYRGHRYCSKQCSEASRRESLRQAGARYRRSPKGARSNASRQKRFRARRRRVQKIVTHQSSLFLPTGRKGLFTATNGLSSEPQKLWPELDGGVKAGDCARCDFCGRPFLQQARAAFLS